ncbi:sensor domain-containing diguanylate cyclase [Paenibacillus mucilaginosus]|uniref:sensor domain-containing diguanylate cyclase n=1 Tax=Paenibacillus mucilaginosus TaxID=61624 RepID=UPI00240DC6E6|nr:PAS domain S-box protein [Paenibacillus mucilaginosus]
MIPDLFMNVAILLAFLFIFRLLFHDRLSAWPWTLRGKMAAGALHGGLGVLLMLFGVRISGSVLGGSALIDHRMIALMMAAHVGGLPSTLTAGAVMIGGRLVLQGSCDTVFLTSAAGIAAAALGTGWIAEHIVSYWKGWAAKLVLVSVVKILVLNIIFGTQAWRILPMYIGMLAAAVLFVASFLRHMNSLEQERRLNAFISELIGKFNASDSTSDIYEITLRELSKLFASETGGVILVGEHHCKGAYLIRNGIFAANGLTYPLSGLGAMKRIREGRIALYSDWRQRRPRGEIDEALYRQGVLSSLHIPLIYKGRTVAIINLGSGHGGHFTDKEVRTAEKLIPVLSLMLALKDAEGMFHSITQSGHDGIVLADSESNIVLWSKGAENLFGYSQEEAVGSPLHIIIPEPYREAHRRGMERHLRTGEGRVIGRAVELEGLRRDGTVFPIELSLNSWQTGGVAYYSSIIRDITQRKRSEEEILLLKQELADTLHHQEGLVLKFKKVEARFVYTMAEGMLLSRLGLEREDIVGSSPETLVSTAQLSLFLQKYEQAWQGERLQFEFKIGGGTFLASLNPVASRGEVVEVVAVISDISQRAAVEEELQESEERYRRLIEMLPDGILVYAENRIVLVNHKAVELLGGRQREQLIGRNVLDLVPAYAHEAAREQIRRIYEERTAVPPREKTYLRLDGRELEVEASSAWIAYKGKGAVMTVFRDNTERKRVREQLVEANERLRKLSALDGLTGIANRRSFDEAYEREWRTAAESSLPLSVLLLDIDSFKAYNDTYGHQSGDACLKQVAHTLESLAEPRGYLAARYGGEEFVCLLPGAGPDEARRFGALICGTVRDLGIPHVKSQAQPVVTVSVGTASAIANPLSAGRELIEQGDRALYEAKLNGRNQVVSAGG